MKRIFKHLDQANEVEALHEVSTPAVHKYEIIFIHGLIGNHKRTWTDEETNEYWPSWLSSIFPRSRILSLQYNNGALHSSPSLELEARGKAVLALLHSHNILKEKSKPVIFIVHSMGGLVLKQVLKQAEETNPNFLGCVKGIIFFATPHRGSTLANTLQSLVATSHAIEDLKNGNKKLLRLHSNFLQLVTKYDFGVLTFAETRAYEDSSVIGMLVPIESANPGVGQFIQTTKDHKGVCRFQARNEANFKIVCDFITNCFAGNLPKQEIKKMDSEFSGINIVNSAYGTTAFCISGPVNGPLVVMLHGLSLGQLLWGKLQPALAESGFRVLTLDFYGHGFSNITTEKLPPFSASFFANQVFELLIHPKLKLHETKMSIIAYSMGTAVAAELASHYKLDIDKMVLISPAGLIDQSNWTLNMMSFMLDIPLIGSLFGKVGSALDLPLKQIMNHVKTGFRSPKKHTEALELIEENSRLLLEHKRFMEVCQRVYRDFDWSAAWTGYEELFKISDARAKPKVLTIWGTDDADERWAVAKFSARFGTEIECFEFADSRHLVLIEKHDQVKNKCVQFLQGQSNNNNNNAFQNLDTGKSLRFSDVVVQETQWKQLCEILDTDLAGGWRDLGEALGKTARDLDYIQQLAVYQRTTPTRVLLKEWGSTQDGKVENLLCALVVARNEDARQLVAGWMATHELMK